MTRVRTLSFSLLLAGILLGGCDSVDPEDSEPLEATLVEDVVANPAATDGHHTFYSLRENRIVPVADSATAEWDLAFRSTSIRINGGVSGPGQGGAQVVSGLFEDVTEAPSSGYAVDSAEELAIEAASDSSWYNYSGPPNHLITPIPGRVLVIRTADGRFAKVRILSYYKGNPSELPADGEEHPARHYTFEYVFQPDGSRELE